MLGTLTEAQYEFIKPSLQPLLSEKFTSIATSWVDGKAVIGNEKGHNFTTAGEKSARKLSQGWITDTTYETVAADGTVITESGGIFKILDEEEKERTYNLNTTQKEFE
jgi:hypothetical protein